MNAIYVPPKVAAGGAPPKVSRGARRHGTISAAREELHTECDVLDSLFPGRTAVFRFELS